MAGTITVSGATMTITGGTSAAPVTLADIVAQAPANLLQNGNSYEFTGISTINIGDGGTTSTFVKWVNSVIHSQQKLAITINNTNNIDTFQLGNFDNVKLIGINGCVLSNIWINARNGVSNLYGSKIDAYVGTNWFCKINAYDCVFGQLSDRLGVTGSFYRNVVLSSDSTYPLTNSLSSAMVPSIMTPTVGSSSNVRMIKKSDLIEVVNVQDMTSSFLIFEDKPQTQIQWTYNNGGFINYGRLKTTPTQNSAYSDSTFSNYQTFKLKIVDPNGNAVGIQSISIQDSQATPVTYQGTGTPTEFAGGYANFTNVLLEQWIDRPGGQAGVTNYIDCAPFTLTVVDTNNKTHTQVISLDDYIAPGQVLTITMPAVQVAPRQSGLVLAETYMVADETHDVYYQDVSGATPTLELVDTAGTVYLTVTMTEVMAGVYHYTLPIINTITGLTIPGYYILKVTNGNVIDVASVEFTVSEPLQANDPRLNNLDAPISSVSGGGTPAFDTGRLVL